MEAMLYKQLPKLNVKCLVCSHYCILKDGKRGICGVRENNDGIMYVLNYGKTVSASIDPIEKKPLFNFMKNTNTYSFAAVGCNMDCPWCQNHSISQSAKKDKDIKGMYTFPKEHVYKAIHYGCPSISYTYSEPTVFIEYAYDTMKLAKEEGLKNIWVTNGYMSPETLDLILPLLDAANVDYKGHIGLYEKYSLGNPKTILENMKIMKDAGVHLEVTTLIIPGLNDKPKDIKEIANDLKLYVGTDTPWHITRFFPAYKMKDTPVTKIDTLKMAKKIGHDVGFTTIYLGNI